MIYFGMPHALMSLHPEAQWRFEEENYESLEWLSSNITKPTQKEIEDEIKRLNDQAEADRLAAAEAELARQAAKQSALIKLSALGLTEEEAKAIVGV